MKIKHILINMLMMGVSHAALGQSSLEQMQAEFKQIQTYKDSLKTHLTLPKQPIDESQLKHLIDAQCDAIQQSSSKLYELGLLINRELPLDPTSDMAQLKSPVERAAIIWPQKLRDYLENGTLSFSSLAEFNQAYPDADIIIAENHDIPVEEEQIQKLAVTGDKICVEFNATKAMSEALEHMTDTTKVARVLESAERDFASYEISSTGRKLHSLLTDEMPLNTGKKGVLKFAAANHIPVVAVDASFALRPQHIFDLQDKISALADDALREQEQASIEQDSLASVLDSLVPKQAFLQQLQTWQTDLAATNPDNVNLKFADSYLLNHSAHQQEISTQVQKATLEFRTIYESEAPGPVNKHMQELRDSLESVQDNYELDGRNQIMANNFIAAETPHGRTILLVGASHTDPEQCTEPVQNRIAEKTQKPVILMHFLENKSDDNSLTPGIYNCGAVKGIVHYVTVLPPQAPIIK